MFFMMACMALSCLMILVEGPQILVAFLVLLSFIMVIFLSLMVSVWYSYILFLVFLGGMLVVFVYVSGLAPSVKTNYNYENYLKIASCLIVVVFFLKMDSGSMVLFKADSFSVGSEGSVYLLMSNSSYKLYLFVVGYLLLTLSCVCGLVKSYEGPLKKF
uniref:NADH dehydrogenase subunit 6 n=1 Tax=Trachelipus rathkii TaxID=1720764 RepID=A0A0G2T4J3_9CRUS|nr:NADH dehydrogenase subunit 6 [Trachelipus rathkii]ASN74427.1 NADH dehydrogenase subunit 6 [Trachelipus rathkii]